MYKGIKHMKGMLAVALMALLVACGSAGSGSDDKPGDDQPGAPLNISITADPASVEASGVTNLMASISGEGAATGTVNWSADEGTLSADSGLSASWTAPAAAGLYTVTATLTTANGASETASVKIEVTAVPEPLTISVTPEVTTTHFSQVIELTAVVDGTGADEATVEWETNLGALSAATGLTTNWTAPSQFGPVTITASIAGAAASDSVTINVLCNSGSAADETDPCVITAVEQLQAIADYNAGHFRLGSDINASETTSWNGGAGFEPIPSFTGTLMGGEHDVSGLYVNRPDENNVGLFGTIASTGYVFEVSLTDAVITGKDHVGGIAGRNEGTIAFSRSSGNVTGERFTGGLAGSNQALIDGTSSTAVVTGSENVGGLVGSSTSTGNIHASASNNRPASGPGVTASGNSVGGLVGNSYGIITDSYSGSVVQGSGSATGGLVGSNWGEIDGSYTSSAAAVQGSLNVGGLAGDNWGFITQSYSLASSVQGFNRVGGLVGRHSYRTLNGVPQDSGIDEAYSMSPVTATRTAGGGGLIAESTDELTVTSSYWDSTRAGQDDSAGGFPRATSQMVQQVTFLFWDFDDLWSIDEGNSPPDLRGNPRQ